MNKNSNYLRFSRNTFIITNTFFIVFLIAILCIQRVIDSGEYKGVDVFEIVDNNKSNDMPNKQSSKNLKVGYKVDEFLVLNDNDKVEYVVTKNKDIFENIYFDNNIIAPGISGTYEFDIINNREYEVKYIINISNKNNSNINLQYRLKKDNEYVIGNENTWINVSNLNLKNIFLKSKLRHLYTLEWRWPYEDKIDNIDTEIGKANNSKYEMKIFVYAEDV